MSDSPLEALSLEIANFAESRRNEVFVPIYDDERMRPKTSLALLFAFTHQRRVETDRDMADWSKTPQGTRVIAVAKRLCRADHHDPDELVQGTLGPAMVRPVNLTGEYPGKYALVDATLLAGLCKPIWLHYLQMATDIINLVDGDNPPAAEPTPLAPQPAAPLMVEP